MITDYKKYDNSWGGNAFNIISTEDFINFNEFSFSFKDNDSTIDQTWAPEFLTYNNEVYIFFSMQKNGETYIGSDFNKLEQAFNRTYYSKALNSELTSWTTPTLLKMPTDKCRIDPCVVHENGLFHLYLCADDHAEIEHFTAQNIDDTWTYVNTLPFPTRTEAPSVVKFNGKYYMFVDSHRGSGNNQQGLYHVAESSDLTNWYNISVFKNQSRLKMRHFTPLVLKTDEQKNIIKELFNKLNNNCGDNILRSYYLMSESQEKYDMSFIDLSAFTDDSCVINELKVMKNTIYYINGINKTLRINKINIDNIRDFDKFYFMVNTVDNRTKIVLKNNCNGNSTQFLHNDYYTIGGIINNSWTLNGFTVKDKRIRFINTPNYDHEYLKPYNFLSNPVFSNGLTSWSSRQGVSAVVSEEHIDVGEKSCYLDCTGKYQGISQNVSLLPNMIYNFSK